jgi:hypothetical protein
MTDWTALGGIVTAGVLGPALGYYAAKRADVRRFQHERGLKASDDLVARLDDSQLGLEQLWEATAELMSQCLSYGNDPDHVAEPLRIAEDAYQVARARNARLSMRPHATTEVVGKAAEAAKCLLEVIVLARRAIIAEALGQADRVEALANLGLMPEAINRGIDCTREFEALARGAIDDALRGSPRPQPSHESWRDPLSRPDPPSDS